MTLVRFFPIIMYYKIEGPSLGHSFAMIIKLFSVTAPINIPASRKGQFQLNGIYPSKDLAGLEPINFLEDFRQTKTSAVKTEVKVLMVAQVHSN